MDKIQQELSRKMGPLPVWAWLIIAVAGIVIVLTLLRGRGQSSSGAGFARTLGSSPLPDTVSGGASVGSGPAPPIPNPIASNGPPSGVVGSANSNFPPANTKPLPPVSYLGSGPVFAGSSPIPSISTVRWGPGTLITPPNPPNPDSKRGIKNLDFGAPAPVPATSNVAPGWSGGSQAPPAYSAGSPIATQAVNPDSLRGQRNLG